MWEFLLEAVIVLAFMTFLFAKTQPEKWAKVTAKVKTWWEDVKRKFTNE